MNRNMKNLLRWAGLCLFFVAGCSSGEEPSVGGRVEHPAQPAPSAIQSAAALPPPDTFTLLDKVIAAECLSKTVTVHRPGMWPEEAQISVSVPRIWSQDVPDRDCTKDSECGDGFCDRGRCEAIRACEDRYGQHCIDDRVFQGSHPYSVGCSGLCLDGRCRSCVLDEECVEKFGSSPPQPGTGIQCTKLRPGAPHHERPCERSVEAGFSHQGLSP